MEDLSLGNVATGLLAPCVIAFPIGCSVPGILVSSRTGRMLELAMLVPTTGMRRQHFAACSNVTALPH